jgi:hypothetical protein
MRLVANSDNTSESMRPLEELVGYSTVRSNLPVALKDWKLDV